jgi:transglutaminase-like putative cysteine protease
MKRAARFYGLIVVFCSVFLPFYAQDHDTIPCQAGERTSYFGVEINGILCGYSVEKYCTAMYKGRHVSVEKSSVKLKASLLGTDFDSGFEYVYIVDPTTKQAAEIAVNVINGEAVMRFITMIRGDSAYYYSPTSGIHKIIPAGDDVIFGSLTSYPYLVRDFIGTKEGIKTYRIYDPITGEIGVKSYSRKSDEEITLSDSVFSCLVLEETDISTGVTATLWINRSDGYNVKTIVSGRTIYFANMSVTSRITTADINNLFFARTGRKIPDIPGLRWLKAKADINSYGEDLTAESLNFPGQKFEGTVNGNNINGIFEIEPLRYSGSDAPPFPPDFKRVSELKEYLDPEIMIECDDPLIINEAKRIASGAKDSWDAAVRLSKWVSENIAGALPGGISALNTLRTMEAECGGHSRLLAAFCRSVGIPSRVVVGCMYSNYYSGGFGQHAWTEVYMGKAGWIPVDATIAETDYVDAGHIRLGEDANFRPVSMEIIDLRTGQAETGEFHDNYILAMKGSYINLEHYRMFKIVSKNGGIAIDIPGRGVFLLNPPDDRGRLFPAVSREISLKPERKENDDVNMIIVHDYVRMKKVLQADAVSDDTPAEFRNFAGKYQIAPGRMSLDLSFEGDSLITQDPGGNGGRKIIFTKQGQAWTGKDNEYEITFIANSENEINALILATGVLFVRGEPVINAMEPVIEASGVNAGIRKYNELKRTGDGYYKFSVNMLHDLGHRLLKKNRTDDAITVFRKNVSEYPGSFMANDALAEAYLSKGDRREALKYFRAAVKLNPDYNYGREKIKELQQK